ncbi:hypothetical protein [Deinococcus knuensis]|uniref:WYL domain-containing protein n=1 Tax=Deinococcus knuensis TaxID=1837380 RepID=A0ABQ2SAZ3_9DEIO|nr:hypothetical protein [Deinococcus knuensis]GGS15616.1 hypothetical protein GCM10008961_03820 [Deinococcus knuensis]
MTYTFTVRDHIIDALTTLGKPATPNEIATETGQVVGSVTSELSKAVNDPEQFSPVARVGEHQYKLTGWSALLPKPTGEPLSDEDRILLTKEMVPFVLHLPEAIQKETSDIEVIQAFAAQAPDPQRILKYRPSDLRLPLYRALERAALERGRPVLTYTADFKPETLIRPTLNGGFLGEIANWTDEELEVAFVKHQQLQSVKSVSPDAPTMYQHHDNSLHVLMLPRKTVKRGDLLTIRDAAGAGVPVTVHVLGTLTPDAARAATDLNITIKAANATWSVFNDIGFAATWD